MYDLETLKRLNEEQAFIRSLPWYMQILVKWGLLKRKGESKKSRF